MAVFSWMSCVFSKPRRQIKLTRTNQSLQELWTLTLKREQFIRSLEFKQVTIWEHEFNQLLRDNETAASFVKSLDIQDRLEPRQAFLGVRLMRKNFITKSAQMKKSTIMTLHHYIHSSKNTPCILYKSPKFRQVISQIYPAILA